MESDAASPAIGRTFGELAEKLSKLRANLDQLLATLDAPVSGRLRCHECGQVGSDGESGWTLRLCADDELHPFCPDCDGRYFSGHRNTG
jgi:hypothetical protein